MRAPLLTLILASIVACDEEPTDTDEPRFKWEDTQLFLDVDDDSTKCPDADEINPDELYSSEWCETDVQEVSGTGELTSQPWGPEDDVVCVYDAVARDGSPGCIVGRPYLEGDRSVTAGEGGSPWLAAAEAEHASVAAFARLTLDLMAIGAPLSLLERVQKAAADEVEHARLCYELAGEEGPGPFPFGAPVVARTDLAAIARDAVREGCLGETVGAWLAERAARRSEDPDERRVLQQLAEDEARHAALSWGIVAWLIREGGDPVRDAVAQALAEPFSVGGVVAAIAGTDDLQRGVREVIEPAARALLAA